MRDLEACRCCLNITSKLKKISDAHRRIYTALSGIEISPGDGYPNYLCMECHTQIRKAIHFRRKVRRAHFVMKEIILVKKDLNLLDINKVDRKKTNLISNINMSVTDRHFYYTMNEEEDDKAMKQEMFDLNGNIFKFGIQSETIDMEDPSQVAIDKDVEVELDVNVENAVREENSVREENCVREEELLNIDLEDVFKDLKEEELQSEESEEELERVEEPEATSVLISGESDGKYFNKSPTEGARILCNFNVRALTLDEQKAAFNIRLNSDVFKNAVYKCGLCIGSFSTPDVFIKHVLYHQKSLAYSYMCEICKLCFKTEIEKETHSISVHMYEYECKRCNEKIYGTNTPVRSWGRYLVYIFNYFRTSAAIHKHKTGNKLTDSNLRDKFLIVRVSVENMYKKALPVKSLDKGRRRYSKKNKSKCQPLMTCDICGEMFVTKHSMSNHMLVNHLFSYKCRQCNQVFYRRKAAWKHTADHGPNSVKNEKIMICQYCPRKVTKYSIVFHIKKYHYSQFYNRHCPTCGMSYSSPWRLYHHQLSAHRYVILSKTPHMEFSCTDCDIQFESKEALQLHQVRNQHEQAKDILHACIHCRKIYEGATEYNEHERTCKIAYQFPMNCPYCGEIMLNTRYYLNHCKKVHPTLDETKGRSKLCELCGETCLLTSWQAHKRKHAFMKIPCNVCGVQLISTQALFMHHVARHSRKPYHCTLCPLRFQLRADCKDHILKGHAPEMPFKCDICDKNFVHTDFLKEHISNMHNVEKTTLTHLTPKKIKGIPYIYPYMKLNVSKIDKQLVNETAMYIYDFNNRRIKKITNNDDHLITDHIDDGDDEDVKPKRKRKAGKKEVNEFGDLLINEIVEDKETTTRKRNKAKNNVNDCGELVVGDTVIKKVNKRKRKSDLEDDTVKIKSEAVANESLIGSDVNSELYYDNHDEEINELEVYEETVVIGDDKFPVTEIDGEQFVTINDILYKIERSDV
ncbi:zinc finger protein 62 homolog [Achroia grisella]|uniref:zinc finger protein 62 homolog n=1 Tax=Achroia grisella TaxID=688607 RepID=UPI0027D21EB8|nr:zinc finger protein 62 homolog [Achroia grisella]